MKPNRGQIIAHFLCLLPFLVLLIAYFNDSLTANPIQSLTLSSGRTAVNLLTFTMACRPVSNLFGLNAFFKIRIITGLYAFFYAVLHFFVFIGLDFGFNWVWILDEIQQKPFIQIGLIALILLVPLTITSINKVREKMGGSWQILQRGHCSSHTLWIYFDGSTLAEIAAAESLKIFSGIGLVKKN